MRIKTAFQLTPIVVAFTVLTACSAATDPTRFYTLKAKSPVDISSNNIEKTHSIKVESLSIPRLLDRPQIVSRIGENEIKRSEYHQWGGPVSDEIEQVLAKNLKQRLATSRYYLLPRESRLRADYNLYLNINRLDGELGNNAIVELAWQLESEHTNQIADQGTIRHTTGLTTKTYSEYVSALQSLLEKSIASLSDKLNAQANNI